MGPRARVRVAPTSPMPPDNKGPRVPERRGPGGARGGFCPSGPLGNLAAVQRGCVRRGASARVSPVRRDGVLLGGAHAWPGLRGTGGRVWEVRASAFEVELLPCLNYVRPSVRSGPGAEARPSGGAGGARAVVPAQVRATGGAWCPETPERWAPSGSGALRPTPGPPTTRGEVSGRRLLLLLEVGTEELGGACRLCVFTRGAIGEAQGRLGWAAFEDGAVLVTSTPVRLLLFSSHLSLLQVKNDCGARSAP